MKEQILALIKRHNDVVGVLKSSDLPVPADKLFKAMAIWYKLANEGADITDMARENGIVT